MNEKTGVAHLRVETSSRLVDWLRARGHEALLARGAVYVDGRRALTDRPLAPDQVVRLHTRPKRYAVPLEPLRTRVVFEDRHLVVLDKPSGLPTHPTLDNALENAVALLTAEYGEPLYVTHRLDIPTEGLLILARDPATRAEVNAAFARGRVAKTYEARADRAVAPGPHAHWLDPKAVVPRPIAAEPREGWWACRLVVEKARAGAGGEFAHVVRPLTGKTHQIRAQFAALGAPLLGDEMYGGRPHPRFGLSCEALAFNLAFREYKLKRLILT